MSTTKKIVAEYYKKFSNVEGNQHIASLFALETIIRLIKLNSPVSFLEIGLGIGSVSYSITEYLKMKGTPFEYSGTEGNEFCLEQLPKNLGENFNTIKLYRSVENLPNKKFDFIIIDGSDSSLESIEKFVNKRTVIFIEGYRISQVNLIKNIFPKYLYTSVVSGYKNPSYGPFDANIWSGGGQLIFTNPTIKQKLFFLYFRIATSFKYKITRKM